MNGMRCKACHGTMSISPVVLILLQAAYPMDSATEPSAIPAGVIPPDEAVAAAATATAAGTLAAAKLGKKPPRQPKAMSPAFSYQQPSPVGRDDSHSAQRDDELPLDADPILSPGSRLSDLRSIAPADRMARSVPNRAHSVAQRTAYGEAAPVREGRAAQRISQCYDNILGRLEDSLKTSVKELGALASGGHSDEFADGTCLLADPETQASVLLRQGLIGLQLLMARVTIVRTRGLSTTRVVAMTEKYGVYASKGFVSKNDFARTVGTAVAEAVDSEVSGILVAQAVDRSTARSTAIVQAAGEDEELNAECGADHAAAASASASASGAVARGSDRVDRQCARLDGAAVKQAQAAAAWFDASEAADAS